MDEPARYRLDDLRRFGSALGAGVGLSPPRAAALATHLLWFDAAGAPRFGIGSLPEWLDRIGRGEIDAKAEGKIVAERPGTLTLDGQGGLPPLVLERAAGLAIEKARDVGVGLVRVIGLGPTGPSAPVAAEVAIGPEAAFVLGPGPSWSLALPTGAGLPMVLDSALAVEEGPLPEPPVPWALLAPDGGWLIAALAVRALEPLATFHERVDAALKAPRGGPGRLLPATWEARRSEARERGVPLDRGRVDELHRHAGGLGVAPPGPIVPS